MNAPPTVDPGLEGHYAGIVSRFAAFTIDIVTIAVLFALFGRVLEYVLSVLLRHRFELDDAGIAAAIALGIWVVLYFAYPIAVSGRTFGMAIVGVRVVRADGRALGSGRAVVRILVLPLSFLLLGLGILLIVLRTDRRALHDLIAGSAVVYAWDARAARVRFLARR
jgi:uncharacterized RDD family membrane protein YckC